MITSQDKREDKNIIQNEVQLKEMPKQKGGPRWSKPTLKEEREGLVYGGWALVDWHSRSDYDFLFCLALFPVSFTFFLFTFYVLF